MHPSIHRVKKMALIPVLRHQRHNLDRVLFDQGVHINTTIQVTYPSQLYGTLLDELGSYSSTLPTGKLMVTGDLYSDR
jgi:hypothetical protein